MIMKAQNFYNGPWRLLSMLTVAGIAIGGYFIPELGLLVIGLMAVALATNARRSRSFCSGICPNGRALSAGMGNLSRRLPLPAFLASKGTRRALCGFMMFCVIGLLSRTNGGLSQIGRVFWSIYLASIGISLVSGLVFKPRSWCAYCPMGTLQDTLKTHK